VTVPWRLQRPSKGTFPNPGKTCGQREREAGAGGREEQSSRFERERDRSKASRSSGWRSSSRGSEGTRISVGPFSWRRVPPFVTHAPATADVLWAPRRGTSSACASKHMHPARGHDLSLVLRGRVLRSVQRPVHVDRHFTSLRRRKPTNAKVAHANQYRGRANP